MNIYELSDKGRKLARSRRSPDTPEWRVIHHLHRYHQATGETLAELGANGGTLSKLTREGILVNTTKVAV